MHGMLVNRPIKLQSRAVDAEDLVAEGGDYCELWELVFWDLDYGLLGGLRLFWRGKLELEG